MLEVTATQGRGKARGRSRGLDLDSDTAQIQRPNRPFSLSDAPVARDEEFRPTAPDNAVRDTETPVRCGAKTS